MLTIKKRFSLCLKIQAFDTYEERMMILIIACLHFALQYCREVTLSADGGQEVIFYRRNSLKNSHYADVLHCF